MAKCKQIHLVDITPEEFLELCSPEELSRVENLILSERFQSRMENTGANK